MLKGLHDHLDLIKYYYIDNQAKNSWSHNFPDLLDWSTSLILVLLDACDPIISLVDCMIAILD